MWQTNCSHGVLRLLMTHVTTVPPSVQNETLLQEMHVFQIKHPWASGNGALGITPEISLREFFSLLNLHSFPFSSACSCRLLVTPNCPQSLQCELVPLILSLLKSHLWEKVYSYIKVFPMLLSYYNMLNIKRIFLKLWFFLKPQGEESHKKEWLINFLKTRDIMNTAQDVSIFCELQIKLRINVFPRVENKNWWSIFWSGNS